MEGTKTAENRQRAYGINSRQGCGIDGDGQARIHKKARAHLEDTNTYRSISTDPTNKLKNRLINILKKIKTKSEINEKPTRRCTLQRPVHLSSVGYLGYIKKVTLRPIVCSIGPVTYGLAKELSRILKPLVGKSIYHVNNSKDFADEIRNKLAN